MLSPGRRRVRTLLLALALAPSAPSAPSVRASDVDTLLPVPPAAETPRVQLERYLTALAHRQLRSRAEAVAGMTTRETLEARRRWVRETVLRLIGGLPATRTPLKARVTGRREGRGFAVENLVYESLPGFPVTANVYVPAGSDGRRPAVIASAGHYDLGKAAERIGPELSRARGIPSRRTSPPSTSASRPRRWRATRPRGTRWWTDRARKRPSRASPDSLPPGSTWATTWRSSLRAPC